MARYYGDLTDNQKSEIEYLENAIKICKKNLKALSEKLGVPSSKRGKTKAQKVEEKRDKDGIERYTRQLENLEANMTEVYEAREKYEQHIALAEYHLDKAEELQKKYGRFTRR